MAQLSYARSYPVGQEGMLADVGGSVIISKQNSSTDVMTATVTAADAAVYALVVNGTAYSITSGTGATEAEITTALKAAIDAGSEAVTVTTEGSTLTLTATPGSSLTLTNVGSATPANVVIATAQSAGQAIPFGRAVCWDTEGDQNTCRLPRASTDVTSGRIWGVTMADTSQPGVLGQTYGQYINHSSIPIVHKGRVWVVCDTDVTAVGTICFVRYGAGGPIGGFTTILDSANAATLTGAKFVTLAAAGQPVQLELNLAI